jgi:hypothetical protein
MDASTIRMKFAKEEKFGDLIASFINPKFLKLAAKKFKNELIEKRSLCTSIINIEQITLQNKEMTGEISVFREFKSYRIISPRYISVACTRGSNSREALNIVSQAHSSMER